MDVDAARLDAYWKMYTENCTQARQHEVQRSTVASVVLTLVVGILGIVTFDKALDRSDIPLLGVAVVLSIFGSLFAAKQYELYRAHLGRAREYRLLIDEMIPGANLIAAKERAKAEHKKKFKRLTKLRLYWFWLGLYVIAGMLVVVLILFAAFWPIKPAV